MSKKELRIERSVEYSVTPPFPRNMLLSLTNTCNQRCIFCCYRKAPPPPPVSMPKEKAFDYIEQAFKLGTREIGFTSISEPFMANILEDCVAYAKTLGYEYVYFTTNGALANKERIEKLWQNGLDSIKFSVNAGDRETYKKVHGRDDFDKVIQNIIDAASLRKSIKPSAGIFVSFVEMEINKGQYRILKGILKDVPDNYYVTPAVNSNGQLYEEMQAGIVANKNILKETDNIMFYLRQNELEKKICCHVFNRFHVTAEGYYDICCNDLNSDAVVADLNKVSLMEAWNCDVVKKIRVSFLNNALDPNTSYYNCMYQTNNPVKPIFEWAKNNKKDYK